MSINELLLTFIVFVLLINPQQSKQTIQKLKKLYKTISNYKQNFQQTINNKLFRNVESVENLKTTNIFVENDITTDNFAIPIKTNKINHKTHKHKKFSTQSTKPTK